MDEPSFECGDRIMEKEPKSPPEFGETSRPSEICDDVYTEKRLKEPEERDSELVQVIILEKREELVLLPPKGGGLQNDVEQESLTNPRKINIGNGAIRDFHITPVSLDQNIDSGGSIAEDRHIMLHGGGSPLIGDNVGFVQRAFRDTDGEDGGSNEGASRVVDLLGVFDLPRTSPGSSGSQVGTNKDQNETREGVEAEKPPVSLRPLLEEERECPICTELYDASLHKQSFLNCNHVFCDNCIKTILSKANQANLGRLACPICRQTTPMPDWEIRKMQERMMDSGGVHVQQAFIPPPPIVRRPGLCGALEYRFQKRYRSGRLFIMRPCVRYPHRFMDRLLRLERRCRCLYLCVLVFFLFAEFFCFAFLFLPILIFVLMIVFGK
ncbi:ring finger protein-like [Mixophyes fleayi]|uniref:ring finger protein-like n=1 Tax=Mixophyes fleayi TaxID=3061075 RepID=UPI003F4D7583